MSYENKVRALAAALRQLNPHSDVLRRFFSEQPVRVSLVVRARETADNLARAVHRG